MNNSWIPFSGRPEDLLSYKTIRGTSIKSSPSPHDIPTSLRAIRDEHTKKIVLEIRYLDSETTIEKDVGSDVVAHIGVNSGRIHRLSVDVSRSLLKIQPVKQFEKALHKVHAMVNKGTFKAANIDIVEKAVEQTSALNDP